MESPVNNPHANDDHKRLVILVGPHKTASTSIQTFFAKYIGNRERLLKLPVLANWTWPWFKGGYGRKFERTKVLAQYVIDHKNQTIRDDILKNLIGLWYNPPINNHFFWDHPGHLFQFYNLTKKILLRQGKHKPQNMVLGTEEFDRFGDTPWSKRDGIKAIQEIVDALQPKDLTIVVNYRTPRKDHWISIYKQVGSWFGTHEDFVCATCDIKFGTSDFCLFQKEDPQYHYKMAFEYLNSVANPLGLVQELRAKDWKVVLIDMGGVKHDRLDIAHTTACEVLKVPCHNGIVAGVDEQMELQTNDKNPALAYHEHDYIEWLFRQRDCAYKSKLEGDTGIEVLHRHSLWDNCTEPAEVYEPLLNTTYMLHLLQVKIGCPNHTTTVLGQGLLTSQQNYMTVSETTAIAANPAPPFLSTTQRTGVHFQPEFLLDAWMEEDELHITIKIQQIILIAFGIPIAAFLFRKLRRPVTRRRTR